MFENGVDAPLPIRRRLGDDRLDRGDDFRQLRSADPLLLGRAWRRSIKLERETPITSATVRELSFGGDGGSRSCFFDRWRVPAPP